MFSMFKQLTPQSWVVLVRVLVVTVGLIALATKSLYGFGGGPFFHPIDIHLDIEHIIEDVVENAEREERGTSHLPDDVREELERYS